VSDYREFETVLGFSPADISPETVGQMIRLRLAGMRAERDVLVRSLAVQALNLRRQVRKPDAEAERRLLAEIMAQVRNLRDLHELLSRAPQVARDCGFDLAEPPAEADK